MAHDGRHTGANLPLSTYTGPVGMDFGDAETMRHRLTLARQAIIDIGYFTDEQVGPDLAPRIHELFSAMTNQHDERRSMLEPSVDESTAFAPPDLAAAIELVRVLLGIITPEQAIEAFTRMRI